MKVRDPSLFSIHADMKFSSQIYHGNRPKPVPLRVDSRGGGTIVGRHPRSIQYKFPFMEYPSNLDSMNSLRNDERALFRVFHHDNETGVVIIFIFFPERIINMRTQNYIFLFFFLQTRFTRMEMEIFKKTLRNFYPIHFNNYRLEDFRVTILFLFRSLSFGRNVKDETNRF